MNKSVFETLEFDKILRHLSTFSISPLGEEHILAIKPHDDIQIITQKLNDVTEFRALIDFDDVFPIDGLQDIRPQLNKVSLEGNLLPAEELVKVVMTLRVFRNIQEYFKTRKEKYPQLCRFAADIKSFRTIEKEISRCVDMNTYEVLDKASPALASIRKSIYSLQRSIRKKLESMVRTLSKKKYLQEDIITIRDGRPVIMIKDEYKNQLKGVIHDQSASGASLFLEPIETLEMNNQIKSQRMEEKREIERILKELTALIFEVLDDILASLIAAGKLDFIRAKAQFSSEINAFQPLLNDKNLLDIVKGRHPLLLLHKGKEQDVIPVNLRMGDSFYTLIITGPNAGGKTVALKTVGLLCLMTSCGLHIPADPTSEIPVFRNIFSAIGDEQSIENNLSTFSSHIEKLKIIVDDAGKSDLVIIDEIGTGTDPEEGAALAIAILEKLTSLGCITLVSTHQGALKAFAHETDLVENGSMEFNSETLAPTYRFRLKIPGSSYAFEIANRWGLPDDIIRRSRELVGAEKNKMENLLIELNTKMVQYQTRLNDISIKQSELDALIKLYKERSSELKRNEKKLKKEAVKESENILNNASATVEQVIRELREQQASRESIRQVKQRVDEEKKKLRVYTKGIDKDNAGVKSSQVLSNIEIGDAVLWSKFNKEGIVLSDLDGSKRVLIDTGGVKIRVPLDELTASYAKKESKVRVNVQYDDKKLVSPELDLRGMMAEEAIELTDKFIEDALISNLHEIYIIHGKGTGALRRKIHGFLDKHNHVKSKRIADWNQGGTGMTVVELR